jgi:hypothetical protein
MWVWTSMIVIASSVTADRTTATRVQAMIAAVRGGRSTAGATLGGWHP